MRQGAVDFPFHYNLNRSIFGFPGSCFGCDKPVFASPPDCYAASTVPLISNSLSIFLGHWAHYLTFIYTYLHFPSSKPTITHTNVNPCLLLGIWIPYYLLYCASPTV